MVFLLAEHYDGENPIRSLIPPLVIFLPGSAITTGTMELAAGQTISGASRLVEGLMDLLLLAFESSRRRSWVRRVRICSIGRSTGSGRGRRCSHSW